MRHFFAPLGVLLLAGACAPTSSEVERSEEGTTYKVYFLGGQSNMEGFGFNDELPDDVAGTVDDVRIYMGEDIEDGVNGGGQGIWAALEPGFGFEASTDGRTNKLSNRFGPELTFGRSMSANSDGDKIAIIKFSRGGTALVHGVSGYGSWDPDGTDQNGRNLYNQALTAISTAMNAGDIDGDGRKDRLVPAGIVWMQGEADAFDNAAASGDYDRNLARLMGLFRQKLGNEKLPVVIGRIKDSGETPETRVMKFSPQVRAAQARYVEEETCAELVTISDGFGFIDGWHYRSQDYIALGKAFAEAMTKLEKSC